MSKQEGKLTIVPTPIGNLDDITIRAVKALKESKYFFCEDTRTTKKLLNLLQIDTKGKEFLSYHEHNERQNLSKAIDFLKSGLTVVMVSDAGMPLINDPGFPLVREIRKDKNNQIEIEVLPGASSVITALVSSGLPTNKFTFLGYFPRKDSERKKLLESIKDKKSAQTYITFESPKRVENAVKSIVENLGEETQMALCIELTKMYERVETGTAQELLEKIKNKSINLKGEFVIVFNNGH